MSDPRVGNHPTRRKLYRRYLPDVCGDVSQSPPWRARLFASSFGKKFSIDCETVGTGRELADVRRIMCEHGLAFIVSKVPHSDVQGRRYDGYEDLIMFRFESAEYPELHSFSANNPAVIGREKDG